MAMCQCGLFNNCNGSCEFCIIKDNKPATMNEIYGEIERLIYNINFISTQEDNWTNKFSDGISILGGEVYYMTDPHYKELFMKLIDVIIEKVIKVSNNPNCRFSTVTNGYYDPHNLLFPVVDRFKETVGVHYMDINFSYDFEYRFKSKEHEQRVRNTILEFTDRYNYIPGIQMILTQHLIDKTLYEGWRPSQWIKENFPKAQLALLYPHPIGRGNKWSGGKNLEGFNFTRESLFKFLNILKTDSPQLYQAFLASCHNSAIFKYTMLFDKGVTAEDNQLPVLSDGKEIINPKCGHSVLYQCYSDTDKCMLCDLETMELGGIY